MTYLGTSYGTHNAYLGELSLWDRILYRLPDALGASKPSPLTIDSRHENLVVWFKRTQPTDPAFVPLEVRFVDDQGFVSKWRFASSTATSRGVEKLGGFPIANYPRTNRIVRMQFSVGGGENRQYLGDFEFLNPAAKRRTTHKSQPLPISRKDGNLEVTLQKIVSNTSWENGEKAAANIDEAATLFALRIRENGKPPADWVFDQITCVDELGNRFGSANTSTHSFNGDVSVFHSFSLWPDALTVKAAVTLRPAPHVAPAEKILLPAIAIGSEVDIEVNRSATAPPRILRAKVTSSGGSPPSLMYSLRIDGPAVFFEQYQVTLSSCTSVDGKKVTLFANESFDGQGIGFLLRTTDAVSVFDIQLDGHEKKIFEFVAEADFLHP